MSNQDCLASLSTSETKIRIVEVREAHEMTFHWLYDPNVVSFSDWLRNGSDSRGSLYWIQGKPGSGKSTLMKFAMKDSRTLELLGKNSQPQWTFVAFFFHDRGSAIQKSLLGMLQEILDSMLKQLPKLRPYAITQYKELVKTQRTRSPTWNIKALQAAINSIMDQRETRFKILLFLDALDEHGGDNDQLVQMLKDWSAKADGYYVDLKICLASRSWNVFEHNFGHGPNFAIHRHTTEDIRLYTHLRLNSLLEGSANLLSQESFEALTEQITTKAQGVFIWVRLVMDQLAKDILDGTPHQILTRKIDELPEELKDLYDHTLSRIEPTYATETHIMLQLVLNSFEPLPLGSLIEATEYCLSACVHGQVRPSASTNIEHGLLVPKLRWLTSRGGGLLEAYPTLLVNADANATDHHVQFLHQTAKEYMQSNPSDRFTNHVNPSVVEKTGFYFLTLASHSSTAWVAPIKIHMLHYAKIAENQGQIDTRIDLAQSWRLSDEDKSGHCNLLWWLKRQRDIFPDIFLIGVQVPSWQNEKKYYAIIVAANLLSLIDDRIFSIVGNDSPEGFMDFCPLQLAIGGPNIVPIHLQDRAEMVRKLISVGYPRDRSIEPWYSVHSKKHREPSSTSKDPRSGDDTLPGEELAQSGIRSLTSRENDSDIFDHTVPMTPLRFLISGCGNANISEDTRLVIAKILLENGADSNQYIALSNVKARGKSSRTSLLSFCTQYRSAALIRLLFQYGARDDDLDASGYQAYDHAILRQDKAVLAAFEEYPERYGPRFLGVDWEDVKEEGVASNLVLCHNILASVGHPGLAKVTSRVWHRRRRYQANLPTQDEIRKHRRRIPRSDVRSRGLGRLNGEGKRHGRYDGKALKAGYFTVMTKVILHSQQVPTHVSL